jgi:hypothetical protein
MRSILAAVLMVVILLSPAASGASGDWVYGSGQKTADALIATGPGNFDGIVVVTDGTNPVTVTIYDSTAASGKQLIPTSVITTSAVDRIRAIGYTTPVRFNTGLYVDITCAGTVKYTVTWK